MDIVINERYKITSDQSNVTIQERKISKPTEKNPVPDERCVPIEHYRTLEQACVSLMDKVVRDSTAVDVVELLGEIRQIRNEIIAAVNV